MLKMTNCLKMMHTWKYLVHINIIHVFQPCPWHPLCWSGPIVTFTSGHPEDTEKGKYKHKSCIVWFLKKENIFLFSVVVPWTTNQKLFGYS